tara:strand:+ start:1573 stop:2016 length:444 start_codon:yes stop_codon:yes gene_type:complete
MRHPVLAITVAAFLACVGPALAQSEEDVMASIENIHGDVDGFNEAFALLQDAFLFDNPTSIADLGFYPLTVNANGETYDVLEAQDLVDNFDSLLTAETIDALASQDYADLIVTGDGVGFANGALWMTNVCLDDNCAETAWGILSINN